MNQKNYGYEEVGKGIQSTEKHVFDRIVKWIREEFIATYKRENDTTLRICCVGGGQLELSLKEIEK